MHQQFSPLMLIILFHKPPHYFINNMHYATAHTVNYQYRSSWQFRILDKSKRLMQLSQWYTLSNVVVVVYFTNFFAGHHTSHQQTVPNQVLIPHLVVFKRSPIFSGTNRYTRRALLVISKVIDPYFKKMI